MSHLTSRPMIFPIIYDGGQSEGQLQGLLLTQGSSPGTHGTFQDWD